MRTSCPDCGKMLIHCSVAPGSREKRRRCVACRKAWTAKELEAIATRLEEERETEAKRRAATEQMKI